MVAFQNHRIFSLRCLKEDLIPVSVKLKSNIRTPKARLITKKVERALLNERIRSINNTLTMMRIERYTCMNSLLDIFSKETMEECSKLITLRREAYYIKVKKRQISKLEQLCQRNRGGCTKTSNMTDMAGRIQLTQFLHLVTPIHQMKSQSRVQI